MGVKVRIPTPLRKLTSGNGEVVIEGRTVQEVIDNLEKHYPGIRQRLCDEGWELRRFVNLYINDKDIRFIQGKESPVNEGDEVSIVPAIAGGSLFLLEGGLWQA